MHGTRDEATLTLEKDIFFACVAARVVILLRVARLDPHSPEGGHMLGNMASNLRILTCQAHVCVALAKTLITYSHGRVPSGINSVECPKPMTGKRDFLLASKHFMAI
eukprot:5784130-Pleurochrysis_carterae.AAC.1